MTAIIQTNTILYITCTHRLDASDVVQHGNMIGVCAISTDYGEQNQLFIYGVFEICKDKSSIPTGTYVYWDDIMCQCTTVEKLNKYLGLAVQDADSDDDTVMVLINYPKYN